MKKTICIAIGFLILGLNVSATSNDSLVYGNFGKVAIYYPGTIPNAIVLFVSGESGWNKDVTDMAENIAAQGALVAGINIQQYLKNCISLKSKCYYPAGDFELLSLTIQKKYKSSQYVKPILVGYSSGASLVYGILAQAPANTFKGAISLSFCPDIKIDKPLCNGYGLISSVTKESKTYHLSPSKELTAPFIVLQGMVDKVCPYTEIKKFMENMPLGELIVLPNVSHSFSVTKNWLPQFIIAYNKILKEPGYVEKKTSQNELLQSQNLTPLNTDLPIILIPSAAKEKLPLAFFISGDGGWTSFDQSVCEKFAEKGMPVIGLDAQKYFWNEKQPKEVATEIAYIVLHYMKQWNKNSFVLIGYSFGACVAPFIADNFSVSLKETLKGVYCLSPDETGDFEIHISDLLSFNTKEKYDVLNELKIIAALKPVCIFGNDEDAEVQKHFTVKGITVETLPGNHHYNNDYNAVATMILKDFLPKK